MSATTCIASPSTPRWRRLTSWRMGMSELRPGPSFSTSSAISVRSCSCWETTISPAPPSRAAPYLGDERRRLDRLGLELVDGDDLLVLVDVEAHRGVDAGEHDDRQRVALLAQLARHVEPVVRLFHHDVEDEQVGLGRLEPGEALGAVRGAVDLVALALEHELAGLDDVGVVVDDQDPGHHTLPLSLAFPHGSARGRRPAATVSRCSPVLRLSRVSGACANRNERRVNQYGSVAQEPRRARPASLVRASPPACTNGARRARG